MNISTLRATVSNWLRLGQPGVVVEVMQARGSVPRDAGTRMLVGSDTIAGTIGGGHLEMQAINHARALLNEGNLLPSTRHFPLGPALGQCCGGAVTLRFEVLHLAHERCWPECLPRFHLQLYGAGHVGRAVARLLATVNVHVDWIDEREDEFPTRILIDDNRPVWPSHIHCISADAVEAEVQNAPKGAYYLVMTHQHDLDQRIVEAVLKREDFAYLGLIGSKTKHERFIRRLTERGVAAATIDRMICPIGIPGVEGKEPEVIAISVVAQLLAWEQK